MAGNEEKQKRMFSKYITDVFEQLKKLWKKEKNKIQKQLEIQRLEDQDRKLGKIEKWEKEKDLSLKKEEEIREREEHLQKENEQEKKQSTINLLKNLLTINNFRENLNRIEKDIEDNLLQYEKIITTQDSGFKTFEEYKMFLQKNFTFVTEKYGKKTIQNKIEDKQELQRPKELLVLLEDIKTNSFNYFSNFTDNKNLYETENKQNLIIENIKLLEESIKLLESKNEVRESNEELANILKESVGQELKIFKPINAEDETSPDKNFSRLPNNDVNFPDNNDAVNVRKKELQEEEMAEQEKLHDIQKMYMEETSLLKKISKMLEIQNIEKLTLLKEKTDTNDNIRKDFVQNNLMLDLLNVLKEKNQEFLKKIEKLSKDEDGGLKTLKEKESSIIGDVKERCKILESIEEKLLQKQTTTNSLIVINKPIKPEQEPQIKGKEALPWENVAHSEGQSLLQILNQHLKKEQEKIKAKQQEEDYAFQLLRKQLEKNIMVANDPQVLLLQIQQIEKELRVERDELIKHSNMAQIKIKHESEIDLKHDLKQLGGIATPTKNVQIKEEEKKVRILEEKIKILEEKVKFLEGILQKNSSMQMSVQGLSQDHKIIYRQQEIEESKSCAEKKKKQEEAQKINEESLKKLRELDVTKHRIKVLFVRPPSKNPRGDIIMIAFVQDMETNRTIEALKFVLGVSGSIIIPRGVDEQGLSGNRKIDEICDKTEDYHKDTKIKQLELTK